MNKPLRPTRTSPTQVPPSKTPRWPGNQRRRQSDEWYPKENPGNAPANRGFNSELPRKNKNMPNRPFKAIICYYCGKDGHMISNCPEKLRMTRQQHGVEPRPTGLIATSLSLPAVSEDMPTQCHNVKTQSSQVGDIGVPSKPVMDMFEPFIHDGSV